MGGEVNEIPEIPLTSPHRLLLYMASAGTVVNSVTLRTAEQFVHTAEPFVLGPQ